MADPYKPFTAEELHSAAWADEGTSGYLRLIAMARRALELEAELARLEALFQATHNVHHSWVAKAQEAEQALRERDEARAAVTKLSERVGYLCEAIDRALDAARRPKTGMQVPFHGDFASAPPSVLGRLEWWARDLRSAMPSDTAPSEGSE